MSVIEFPNKRKEYLEQLEKEEMKEIINYILDNYDGDFCMIFKSKGVEQIFEERIQRKFVAVTNAIEKFSVKNEDYFFEDFDNDNIVFFDLRMEED